MVASTDHGGHPRDEAGSPAPVRVASPESAPAPGPFTRAMKVRLVALSLALVACGGPGASPAEAPAPEPAPRPPAPTRVPIAITIDDLPWVGPVAPGEDRSEGIGRTLAAARAHGAPVAGFVTCANARARAEELRRWIEAGITLGNHTRSHRALDELGLEAWREDVVACQRRLEATAEREVPFFRYPYLRTGRERELRDAGFGVLEQLGLRRAPVSVDTSEWALVRPYVRARASGDDATAGRIASAYVAHLRRAARRSARLAEEAGHAGAPLILLLHANALAADHLGAVLSGLREDGFRFVSLEDALADPLYAREDRYAGPVGLSWLYRIGDGAAEAWSWDAAQLHALKVRFAGDAERARFDLDRELSIRRVAERTWVVTHAEPWAANSLVAEMADGALLFVDTPYTSEATRSLSDWAHARFGPRRLIAIDTHFHPDAVGGNRALAEAGATVYGSTHTARLVVERRGAMREQLARWLRERPEQAARFAGYDPLPPTETFEPGRGLELELGEPVRALFPGAAHSPDNVVVHLPDRGVLFGGCMVVAHDRLGNLADADLEGWPAALERLEALQPAVVVPGHGDPGGPELLGHTRMLLEGE
jgi:metallo-beta-lactamase class B